MSSSLSLRDAKITKRAKQRETNPRFDKVDSEPLDPQYIDHQQRRNTRLVPSDYKADAQRTPLMECGCGQCSNAADPLADVSAFNDIYAGDICDNPRPLTLDKARDVYLGYKRKEMNTPDETSPLERTRNLFGRVLGGERELLSQMDSPSLLFVSLRQSPIMEDKRRREWIRPVRLCEELHSPWKNIRRLLSRRLSDKFPRWEYARVTGYTTSAATPHFHLLVYVEDPDDELSLDVGRAVVDSHLRGNQYAERRGHPVVEGESDAAMVTHHVPRETDQVGSWSRISVNEHHDVDNKDTSNFIRYMMNQLPHWVLDHIWENNDINNTSTLVDGAVISWASPYDDYGSSRGFPD